MISDKNNYLALLNMIYDKVDSDDCGNGLFICYNSNSPRKRIYRWNEEIYKDICIKHVNIDKYFVILKIMNKPELINNSLVDKSVILNRDTLEEVFTADGSLSFCETVLDGKYVIARQNLGNNAFLIDIPNKKLIKRFIRGDNRVLADLYRSQKFYDNRTDE